MDVISELKDYAESNEVPIIQDDALAFLLEFIAEHNIVSILEIGTAIGYSALQMSMQPSVKRIVSLERNYGLAQIAKMNIKRAKKSKCIEVVNQDALDYQTAEHFDLLFIDGAKAQYQRFFDRFIANVDYVFVDNLAFHGLVENPGGTTNRHTRNLVKKLAKFKSDIISDDNYHCKYYNLGDGILLISK